MGGPNRRLSSSKEPIRGSPRLGLNKMQVTTHHIKFLLVCITLLHLYKFSSAAVDSPPRITIQPNDLIAIEGESAELNCDAEGQPEPSIEWYHNGQLIRTSTHSRTTMGGSIQFLDIRPATPAATNGKPTDTGTYYCLAKNSLGQAKSRNASLQVAYIQQEFRAVPKDNLVAIGETAVFDCMPQAWPEPRIQWRHDGRLIESNEASHRLEDGSYKYSINKIAKTTADDNGKSLARTQIAASSEIPAKQNDSSGDQLIDLFGSQLVIRRVDKNDEGRYSCLVETKGSHRLIERESLSAQLLASVKPYFIEAPEHKTVQVGGQVKLRCRMGGDPEPVISWRKQNGQPLSEKVHIDPDDKTLTLEQVTVADQGTYICEGENSIGSARSLATVSVNSRPKFIIQPEDQEADLGSKVQIKCVGEASPQPMLFWYKEGHRQLMFAPASTGTLSSSSSKQSFLDWPQASPLFSASDYRGPSGSMATSDTSPSINKLFSMPINPDQSYASPAGASSYSNNYFGNRIYVDNQGTLNIINVTSSDNGYYACALISSVGSVMGKAKLTVRQTPNNQLGAQDYYDPLDPLHSKLSNSILQNSKFDLLPPPVIKLGAANQTLPTDVNAILVCEVVSQVAYKIQWFFESQPLQEEAPRVTTLDNGALNINNLKTSDSGIYTCLVTAANDQSMPMAAPFEPLDSSMLTSAPPLQQSTSHSTMLKVASPLNPNIQFFRMDPFKYPSSPGPAYLVSTNGNDAITIAWVAPSDSGNLPIKEYIVEHYDTSQEHLGWRVIYRIKGKESLLIDGLSPDGSHFFVIRAANGHGVGPSSAIAGPMRTVAGETRYQAELQKRRMLSDSSRKPNFDTNLPNSMRMDTNIARERLNLITTNLLSLTPQSSTSIRLQWSIQVTGNLSSIPPVDTMSGLNFPLPGALNVDDFIEGYSIRYRALGLGESLLSKDPFLGAKWSAWPSRDLNVPSSLPLITSYVETNDDNYQTRSREKRDLSNYFDYSQFEFNEVKVVDHNTESYTINGLRPFTLYQFFVVPYYKDIDGTPSNHLQAQTSEDRPAIAPPNLTVRPINNTAVRLLWLHLPREYANGIIRGYAARINRSDILNDLQQSGQSLQQQPDASKIIFLPLGSLGVAPFPGFNSGPQLSPNSVKQYIVMHDLTNLTYKSFYSIQVAAYTNVGSGLWSEPQNFIMDPAAPELKVLGNDFEDVMSKSLISSSPQLYGNSSSQGGWKIYLIVAITLIALSFVLASVYLLYRRNNQKVITWKKTISEHFNNKFYMPASVDHQEANSRQQNIYDHQQHLIYSDPNQLAQQSMPAQTLWANNEYEELNTQQPNNIIHTITNADRHQSASSNSDTSCPSSVTRLLPNPNNYNRDLSSRTFGEKQRHEMVLQQQVYCNDGKQPFATMINSDNPRMQTIVPLSPYATTNLMNQPSMPSQQYPQSFQTSLINQSRQHNFVLHNVGPGGHTTMDDSSTPFLQHNKQINGVHNPMSVFRTSQRSPRQPPTQQQFSPQARPQVFMQTDSGGMRFYNQQQNHQQQNLELGPYQSEVVIYKAQNALQQETDSLN